MTIVITKGDHARASSVPVGEQYAHQYMPTDDDGPDPEGHEHQAWNFTTYANALGGGVAPHVLLSPPAPDDAAVAARIQIEMMDWAAIVEGATGKAVETR